MIKFRFTEIVLMVLCIIHALNTVRHYIVIVIV